MVKMMKMKTTIIVKMNDLEIVVKKRANVENKETVMAIRIVETSKEPVCPRGELILKIIIILLIIFLGFIKSKPC